jgi:hypothetical protein
MNLDSLIQQIARRTTISAIPSPATDASTHTPAKAAWPFDRRPLPEPMRRKALVARIRLQANRFRLEPLIDALLEAYGHNRLGDLPDADLVRLDAWMEAHVDRLHTLCSDPAQPPAD